MRATLNSSILDKMNFDNAIIDTVALHPGFDGRYLQVENTPNNERCWRVVFTDLERTNGPTGLEIEVILRDNGIVMSVMQVDNMSRSEVAVFMDDFADTLNLTPE
jgi:hypothetical protein